MRYFQNFVEVFTHHAEETPSADFLTYIPSGPNPRLTSTFDHLHQKAKTIAGFLREETRPGDRARLIYEHDLEFIYAFTGCLYASVVAVPVYPPTFSNMLSRLTHIIDDASPAVCLLDGKAHQLICQEQNLNQFHSTLEMINTETLPEMWSANYSSIPLNPGSLAFLQYTSGSTGRPKGVMVTHGNLLHNEEIMKQWQKHTRESILVGCIPLYHDMGLIGNVLQASYVGCRIILLSNQRFLRSPLSWVKTISEYRATTTTTTSGGSNFAFELCIRAANPKRIKDLDLSCWGLAFTGAEPVRYHTLQRFTDTFAPCGFRAEVFFPCYGLAEATLAWTAGIKSIKPRTLSVSKTALNQNRVAAPSNEEDGVILVSNGNHTDDQRLEIVNSQTYEVCAENEIGEIWLQGPSVTAGYWQKPDLTEKTFHAYLANGEGPFLRTGDLGFISENGLYCSGRLKDVIILNGRNYYPQDIETAVEGSHPKIKFNHVAAFSINEQTNAKLIVVAEYKGKQQAAAPVINAVRLAVSSQIGIKAEEIVLVRSGTLPFTTSGKIRRKETKKRYLEDQLDIIHRSQKTPPKKTGPIDSPLNSPAEITSNGFRGRYHSHP